MLHCLSFSFLFFSCLYLCAQQPAGYNVQQYGTEDGLPSNGIKGLQWDKSTGFLWIATEAGMVRYNGMSFKTFTNDDDQHISNERILFAIKNKAGRIYTADNTGNIFTVSKNKLSFIFKRKIEGNPSSNVIMLRVSEELFKKNHVITSGPFATQFDQVFPESDTSAFILHQNRLYYFRSSLLTPTPVSLPAIRINYGFISNNEIFLADGKNELWLLNKKTKILTKSILEFDKTTTLPDPARSIFFWETGMQYPIMIFEDKAWKIMYGNSGLMAQLIGKGIPQDALIRYVQYDDETHTLFIGTDSKGVTIIKANRVKPMIKERKNPKERTSYYSQLELPDGNIVTNEGHVIGNNFPASANVSMKEAFSNSTYLMGDTLFWHIKANKQLKYSCLHSYNIRTGKITVYPKVRERFAQMVMSSSGGKLYAANGSGIFRMEGDSLRQIYTYPAANRVSIHFMMIETEPGVLAIANCNALLQYNIASGKMDTLSSPGNYCVRSIWKYKDYLFFGTYGNGFFVSKNGKVKKMPPDKNGHLLFTHCFIDDGNGYCWISTNRGLFKVSIAELINAYETDAKQVYYHYFGRNDGMEMTEMNGGCAPCAIRMKNSTISFPTMEGLLWVNPESATPVLPVGEIFIDEIVVDGKRKDLAIFEAEPLTANRHDIQVGLGFSAWCNKENIYVQYRLNNDSLWQSVNVENGAIIQLNNLPKGKHVLRIRKANGFGINNYSYKEVRFAIPVPWYQRWWFYVLALLVVWGFLALYFRYRTRQLKLRQRRLEKQVTEKTKELQEQNEVLEKNNSIKTRLISIISHDIVTPLKFLTVAGKNLQEKRLQMPEALQQETIKEMTSTSQELQLLSTNILNWIKYQNENRRLVKETFNLYEMVEQVLGILRSLAKQKNLLIENQVNAGMEIYQLYEPLKILVYNLLTNAINFSEKGIIAVVAHRDNDSILLQVRDEGTGMTAEQIQRLMADEVIITSANVDNKRGHGLGYLIIKDLVKTMNASLQIKSAKGAGTTVVVTIPAVRNESS